MGSYRYLTVDLYTERDGELGAVDTQCCEYVGWTRDFDFMAARGVG